jgi:PqqD family protein of HPr-rel-A system
MNEQDRPTWHPAVETAVFETEVVVYDDRSGIVHHLNPSASAIWLLLDGRPLAAVIDRLQKTAGLPRDDLRPDVVRAITAFRDADLLAD